LEKLQPSTSIVWNEAMNKRVGLHNAPLHEVYHEAQKQGMNSTYLYTIPEQDDWKYNTTRNGQPVESMVMICNDLVCEVLKAGGVFKKFGNL
jgi:hypothetical protein